MEVYLQQGSILRCDRSLTKGSVFMNRKSLGKIKLKKIAIALTSCVVLCFSCVIGGSAAISYATTKDEAEREKDEAGKNEKDAKEVLESLEKQQQQILADIEELDSKATKIQTKITDLEEEKEELQTEIDETNVKLKEAQKAEDDQYEAMKLRIQYLYEEGKVDYVGALVSSTSFTDILNKSEYIDQISCYDQEQLRSLISTKNDIADYEKSLEKNLIDIESIMDELEQSDSELQEVLASKKEQLSRYDDDIAAQTMLMNKFAAQRQNAERRIAEIARQEMLNALQNGDKPVIIRDGTIYDASKYKGRFMWPVPSSAVITDFFGGREAPIAGASTDHKGLDIGCDYGSDIVAAEDGVVVMSCYNGGAGNMVMLSHSDGICTVYMHNSQLCVNVGEKVVKGQVIAKAGSTGVSTGTHCHFGVSVDGTYVDPLIFL